jgi:cytoskeletal protein CcmA (bactofilin family)
MPFKGGMKRSLSILLFILAACAISSEQGARSLERGADRFAAGESPVVTRPVKGDLIAAGGELRISAPVGGDVLAAGGSLAIEGSLAEDLYAAGGEVRFDGALAGNARVAGGSVGIGRGARIDGNASVAGGRITVQGALGGYLHAAGGRVLIDGPVRGDVEVAAGELEIGPQARIEGGLRYRTREPLRMDPAAQVRGGVERVQTEGYEPRHIRYALGAAFGAWLLGLMLLAALLAWLLPRQTARIVQATRQSFGWSLLVGFLALVALPPAIVILLVTLVGIPLAVVGLLAYLALLLVGYAAAGIALGNAALPRWQGTGRRALAAALGVLVINLFALVPWLGALLAFIALIVGMGAVLMSLKPNPQTGA